MFRSIQAEFQTFLDIIHAHTESQRSIPPIDPSIATMDLQLLIVKNDVEKTRIDYESRLATAYSENDRAEVLSRGRALAALQSGLTLMENRYQQIMSEMISLEENNSLLIKLSHHYPFAQPVLRFLYDLDYFPNEYTYAHVNGTLHLFYFFKPFIDTSNILNSTSKFVALVLLAATIVNAIEKINDAKLTNVKFAMRKFKEKLMLEYVNNFLPVNYHLNIPESNASIPNSNISWLQTFLYPDNYIDYANNKFRFLVFFTFVGIEAIMNNFVYRDETTAQMIACILFMLTTRMISFPFILTKAGMLDNAMMHPVNRNDSSMRWTRGFRETNDRLGILASNVADMPFSIASSIHNIWRRPVASTQVRVMDVAVVEEAEQSVPLLTPSM